MYFLLRENIDKMDLRILKKIDKLNIDKAVPGATLATSGRNIW